MSNNGRSELRTNNKAIFNFSSMSSQMKILLTQINKDIKFGKERFLDQRTKNAEVHTINKMHLNSKDIYCNTSNN